MNIKIISLFILFIASWLSSCGVRPQTNDRTLFVSIQPLRSLVRGIVGDDFEIEVLVPSGSSPETFEPTPRQFGALNEAQLVFHVGLIDFEEALSHKLADPCKIVNLSRNIRLIEGSCSHASHNRQPEATGSRHAHHAHGVDPHVWTSPKALCKMAENAYAAIRAAYPDSTKYAANYERLQKDLEALDARTAAKIARSSSSCFLIYHPALTYYARDYGLQQIAIEADGKEPSAKRLAEIIRRAQADGIRKVFYQSQFPASVVEVIAHDLDAEAVAIDPLREEVIANIDAITDLIVEP